MRGIEYQAFSERRFVDWQKAQKQGIQNESEEKTMSIKSKTSSKVVKKVVPIHLRVGF